MNKKDLLDIEDIESEFSSIKDRLYLLKRRFIALAMDYKHHVDNSFEEEKIYILRDQIQFRLFAANFHLELLFDHLFFAEKQIELEQGMGFSVEIFKQQITSLLDSFIYHTVSVFDYLGTLTNYISGAKKDKTLMWTQLAKSVRDGKNELSKTTFSKVVDQMDRDFVCKLYDYRSSLIHRKADVIGYNTTYSPKPYKVTTTFYAGKYLIKNFKDLKILSKENDLTVKYVSFWILNKTIDNITNMLFSLKKEIESRSKGEEPTFTFLHPETNERLPASVRYWNEALYKQNKTVGNKI